MSNLLDQRKDLLNSMMRDGIYQAAVKVIQEHGSDALTMDRVASAANVAKGSLYNYFRGKKELLEFVYAKTIDPVFQDLEDIVASDQPAVEKLSRHLCNLLEHVAKHSQVHKLLFEDDTTHGLLQSSERSTFKAASQLLAVVFRQGIAEGVFRPADPLMLAYMHLGLCKGVLQSQPELEESDQRENIHRLIMSTLLQGISTGKGEVG